MEVKNTKSPLHCKQLIGVTERGFALFYTQESGPLKRTLRLDSNGEFTMEDAERIVRACNSFPALVDVLERAKAWCEEHGDTRHQWYLDACSALALAKGERA